jgi:muconate cycloisomerase
MNAALFGGEPAKAAIDIAVHDAIGKTLGTPVSTLLGGRSRTSVPVTRSIGVASPEAMTQQAKAAARDGIGVVKLKIDGSALDLGRIAAVRSGLGPHARIRLDANAAFTQPAAALRHLLPLLASDIYMIEQPLHPRLLAGMAEVRRGLSSSLLLADESIGSPVDAANAARADAADVWNIKVQGAGGLYPAAAIASLADAMGIPVLVGSRMETGIGAAAGLQLMASITELAHPCDLKAADTYDSDLLVESLQIVNGAARIPDGPGLGVGVNEDVLAQYAIQSAEATNRS